MGITLLAAGSLGSAQWKKAKDKNAPAAGSKKPTETKTAGKVPQSGDGPEPPKPATSEKKAAKSNFRSSKRSKPKCKHECLGNQRCRHIRYGYPYISIGECVGINCAGVRKDCGPCYKHCPDIRTKTTCDYNCETDDQVCEHTTKYPDGRSRWGTCAGTNCGGVTEACGACYKKCPNIRTEPKCEYKKFGKYECRHTTLFPNGGMTMGGCFKTYCSGVTDVCKPCSEKYGFD